MSQQDDRFQNPRPKFTPSTNELLNPKPQHHHAPSPSLISRAENEGSNEIAELMKHAQEEARSMAKIQKHKIRKKRSSAPEKEEEMIKVIDPSLIVSDEEFIKRTRGRDIFDQEVKDLFFANGGEKHLVADTIYGVAFENLKREKLHRMRKNPPSHEVYKRSGSSSGMTPYVSGIPDNFLKERLNQEAKIRNNNSFFGFVSPRRIVKSQ